MSSLSSVLFKDYFTVSRDILDCDRFEDLYFAALHGLERVLEAATSCLLLAPEKGPKRLFIGGLSHGVDEVGLARYLADYQTLDPLARSTFRALTSAKSEVSILDQLVDYRTFRQSKFYNEFYRPNDVHHVLGIGVRCGIDTIGVVGLHRPEGRPAFTAEDLEKARLFVPALSASLTKTMVLDRLHERDWLIGTLSDKQDLEAILILDERLSLIFANKLVATILGKPPLLGQSAGVALPEPLVEACLEAREGVTASLAIQREFTLPQGLRLKAVVEPLVGDDRRIRYLIKISKALGDTVSTDALAGMGLTKRETTIADLVATGLSNPQIADRLGISVRTVENHLRSVFDKAGVNNRTALACRMSGRTSSIV